MREVGFLAGTPSSCAPAMHWSTRCIVAPCRCKACTSGSLQMLGAARSASGGAGCSSMAGLPAARQAAKRESAARRS
eukprot:49005-Lingulodinium_polyedra.AAC.1